MLKCRIPISHRDKGNFISSRCMNMNIYRFKFPTGVSPPPSGKAKKRNCINADRFSIKGDVRPTTLPASTAATCGGVQVQGWAKEWALGCVNPASWLPLAAGGEFTQPRAHSFAHLCTATPHGMVAHVLNILHVYVYP